MLEVPQGPITVTVTKRFDKENPAHNLYVCKTDEGKEVKAYKPDEGDDSHMPYVQVGDRIKVGSLVAARRRGEFKGKVLARNEQLNATQTEWRRREKGEHREFTRIDSSLSEHDHACLKFGWKLERKLRPSLTLHEYHRELVMAQLLPVRALWLSQMENS